MCLATLRRDESGNLRRFRGKRKLAADRLDLYLKITQHLGWL
jgi:hypothetical protein